MKRGREPEPPPHRRAVHPIAGAGPRQAPPPVPAASQKLTTNDALSYLREVKNRFADRKQVYDTFLDIMKEFKAQRIDTSGVIVRVKQLFKGHRELILGFNTFLPKGYEIELARISDDEEEDEPAPKQAVEFDQAINYVNKIKNRFSSDERVYKAFLEILNMYRKGQKNISHVYSEVAVLFQNHDDLLHEFTYFLPDNSQQGAQMRAYMRNPSGMAAPPGMRPPGGMGGRPPMGRGNIMAQHVGQGMGAASPHDHSRLMHKRKAARRAEEGFMRMDGQEDGYGRAPAARGQLAKEMQFLDKVKTRLRSKEQYGDFLKCLNMYSQEIISRNELVGLVADILGRERDLITQFQQFITSCEHLDMGADMSGQAGGMRGGPAMTHRDLLKAKLQKDKYMTKPLSEIVAGESERITPSYVKMPVGYPKLNQSGRTALGDEVLNDQYVNVITGSEDYSFKLMRKNQYEEALFRCEDDRYEFDIVCEQNMSTMRVFRPIAERLALMSPEDRLQYSWQDVRGVNSVHLGHIQRLYGESGNNLVDLLLKNPAVAIPVILTRLEAKALEWRKVKEEMVPTWKKIYEQNYPRSLDHRSFYFKQAEKKCMMTKAMVAEIKEAADKRKADEQHLRTLSMAFRHSIPATAAPTLDLTFTYADRGVFEDVFQALKSAVDHQLHAGHREQVMMLYLQTIEPFFGLQERADEITHVKEQAEDDGPDKDGDVGMADIKSDSSEEAAGNGEEVQGPSSNKTTPGPEGTPEPGAEEKPQPSGDQTAATDMEGEGNDEAHGRRRSAAASADTAKETRAYGQCKPIMPWAGVTPSQHHHMQAPGCRLLFGNEHMYVFFRYHRYLYERLASARKFSLEVATKKATAPVRGGGPLGVPIAEDGARTPAPEVSEASIKEDADVLHGRFMSCLTQMLSTGSDVGAFEDQVRNLLGTNSYELFTLDKLLNRIVKHLQLMVSDDHTFKLWEMYQYERSRGRQVSASMYHVNCHTVLDDTCYRIEFCDNERALRFQQNDAERSDAYLAPEGAVPAYIGNYVNNTGLAPTCHPTIPHDASHRASLFLRRTLAPLGKVAADEALVAALGKVWVNNGLETKIACTTCKVSYVLDTEDTMVRKVRKPSKLVEAARDSRLVRFSAWLTKMNDNAEKRRMEEEEAARTLAAAVAHG